MPDNEQIQTIYPATISKTINGVKYYIYPKTNTLLVKRGNQTLEQALSNIETTLNSLTGEPATTNSLGIVAIGENVNVSSAGVISVPEATTTVKGVVKVGDNINVSNGTISIPEGTTTSMGVLKVGTNLNVNSGEVSISDATTSNKGVVQLSNSITSDSQTTAASSKAVSDLRDELLGLASGQTINTNFDTLKEIADWLTTEQTTSAANIVSDITELQNDLGKASTQTTSASGLHATVETINTTLTNINNTYIAESDYATTTLAGIVQIGNNINVNNTGVISVNTGSATELGVVKAGTNIAVSSGVISVNTGSTTAKGVVKVGDNISVTDGTISIPNASDIAKGVVKVGTNITVSDGVISIPNASTTTNGVVTLSNVINSTSTTLAATANSVKMAYDAAVTLMTGATASAAGTAGRVPAPAAGDNVKLLRGDGTWVAGYSHPTYTAQTGVATTNQTPGFGSTFNIDQFTSDSTGHITGRTTRTVTIPNTYASASNYGIVKISTNISESNGEISVLTATNAVKGVVQVGTNIAVSNGIISVADASTSAKGVVQLSSALNSTSTTLAATASAVKDAYDAATTVMTGATASAAGATGRVPVPVAGDNTKFLRGDGTWVAGYSHPTYTAQTGIASANQTPAFGGTFNIDQFTSDSTGHITGRTTRTVTIPATAATASALGLVKIGTNIAVSSGTISVTDGTTSAKGVVQLSDAINSTSTTLAGTANAVKKAYDAAVTVMGAATASAAGTAGRVPAPAAGANTKYLRGDGTWNVPYTHPTYTAQTGVATANQTPAFGATFNIDQFTSDATGHVSGRTTRTVTIPATAATTSALGLVKVGTNIAVSSGTISVADGTTSAKGVVQLSSAINSTSTTLAATASAVKTAYDAAVTVMSGATASAAGAAGRVPAPAAGDTIKFLRSDGTWQLVGGGTQVTDNEFVYKVTDVSGEYVLLGLSVDGDLSIAGEIQSQTIEDIHRRLKWLEEHL